MMFHADAFDMPYARELMPAIHAAIRDMLITLLLDYMPSRYIAVDVLP